MYYRNAQAALVVYDLTKASSLVKAKHWVAELQRQASPGIVIALVGNKFDLASSSSSDSPATDAAAAADASALASPPDAAENARKIPTDEAEEYAKEENLLFFETSAKTGFNVAEVFTAIANAIPETSLRSSRGGAAGRGAQGGDEARVNLTGMTPAAKDNCAC